MFNIFYETTFCTTWLYDSWWTSMNASISISKSHHHHNHHKNATEQLSMPNTMCSTLDYCCAFTLNLLTIFIWHLKSNFKAFECLLYTHLEGRTRLLSLCWTMNNHILNTTQVAHYFLQLTLQQSHLPKRQNPKACMCWQRQHIMDEFLMLFLQTHTHLAYCSYRHTHIWHAVPTATHTHLACCSYRHTHICHAVPTDTHTFVLFPVCSTNSPSCRGPQSPCYYLFIRRLLVCFTISVTGAQYQKLGSDKNQKSR